MSGGFLFQAMIYLLAAVLCVPVAKRLGMGSVLGYLLAGIIIGPFVLGFVGEEGTDIMHFAEFGVVMMLFLIGLELEPQKFLKMWRTITGMGGLQVSLSTLIFFGLLWSFGWRWQISLATGLALALSSTAIVLQTLKEKGLIKTAAGQGSFSILLFQDIAVIPILAVLPLLASGSAPHGDNHSHSLIEDLAAGWQTLIIVGAIAAIILAGRYLVGPLLRLVAKTRLVELFTASALLLVFAIAYLMELVGLSPALGTFLGGVVLANSEFRHELEGNLEPFKGLLLGLFFIAVGASINFTLIAANPGLISGLVLGIMLIKFLVLLGVGRLFGFNLDQNLLLAVGLAQVGEFSFVLFSFMRQLNIFDQQQLELGLGVTALSMTVTPLVLLINERLVQPRVGTRRETERPMDQPEENNAVILVGFAHFGSTVGRFLRANGVEATILDNDSDRVELLRKMGFKVYYGDATRQALLESAGAENAKLLISAIDDPATNLRLVELVQKHFPNLQLMVRAKNRLEAYELLDMGIEAIYRESLDSSLRMGVDALHRLGYRRYSAYRSAQRFIREDERSMRKLAKERHDRKTYIQRAKEEIEGQEKILRSDMLHRQEADHAWDSEEMRQKAAGQKS